MIKEKSKAKELIKRYPFLSEETRSYSYTMNPDCGPKEFIARLKEISNFTAKPHYKSESSPTSWKVSRELVGDTFKAYVLDSQKDQAVYFYSDHCAGCKKFTGHYEKLAADHITGKEFAEVEFNRINSPLNHLGEHTKSFHSTPVFAFYKKGHKNRRPLIYRQPILTPEMLRDFYKVSSEVSLVEQEQEKQLARAVKHSAVHNLLSSPILDYLSGIKN